MKSALKIGLVVLIVAALATTGVALALESTDPAPAAQGGAEAGDAPDLAARIADLLVPLVEDGTLTRELADAVAEHLADCLPRPPRRNPLPYVRDLALEAADFLDMEPLEVVEAVRDGATLADLAAGNGSSGAALIEHLVEEVEDDLEQAVADERITQEQADAALERATGWITDAVNGELEGPIFPRPRGAGHGPGGSGGPGEGLPFSGAGV